MKLRVIDEDHGRLVCMADSPLASLFQEHDIECGADERIDRDAMVELEIDGTATPQHQAITTEEPDWSNLSQPSSRGFRQREVSVGGTAISLGSVERSSGKPTQQSSPSFSMEAAVASGGDAVQVVNQGGSRGRLTTMVGEAEWSATGRIGVSLAELSAVKDVGFAFNRALSRLIEMQSPPYVAEHARKNGLGGKLVPSK